MTSSAAQTRLHASTVAIGPVAVAMIGESGSGKSALAIQLMALGAKLVADDQTKIERRDQTLWASKPKTLPNRVEARGVGLLRVPLAGPTRLRLIVDMDETEQDRLPEAREIEILGQKITVWRKLPQPHFPAAIFVYLSSMLEIPQTQI